MPPTILFIGTRDPMYPALSELAPKLKQQGAPVELFAAEGGLHGYFKFTPWLEKTTLRLDAALREIGYLAEAPRVEPPSQTKPEGHDERTAKMQEQWLERHARLQQAGGPVVTRRMDELPPSRFTYKEANGASLRLYVNYPPGWRKGDRRSAMLLFQGGGFNPAPAKAGPRRELRREDTAEDEAGPSRFSAQAGYFTLRGMVALNVEYRARKFTGVMPQAAIEDARSAMRFVRANATMLGIDPERIVAYGGSSGGTMAAGLAALDHFNTPGDDLKVKTRPAALLLHYPLLDWLAEHRMSQRFLDALNGDRDLAAKLSPARYWNTAMPPTLVMIGTGDPMYESLKAWVAEWKAKGAHVDIFIGEGGNHGFSLYSPWLEKTIGLSDGFLRGLGLLKDEPRAELPTRPKPAK